MDGGASRMMIQVVELIREPPTGKKSGAMNAVNPLWPPCAEVNRIFRNQRSKKCQEAELDQDQEGKK